MFVGLSFFTDRAFVAIDRLPIFAKMLPQSPRGWNSYAAGNDGRLAAFVRWPIQASQLLARRFGIRFRIGATRMRPM
jgi:hypothetical protein